MENNDVSQEFSQELSDLKWQFENMQQIFSNLENTVSEAKKSSDNEEESENGKSKENKEEDRDIFSNQFGKQSSSKDKENKETKPKEPDTKKNSEKEEKPNSSKNIKSDSVNKSSEGTQKLSTQIQDFIKESQTQQSKVAEGIQKSIKQAMDILNQANDQIKTNQSMMMMNQFINQAEQQMNKITQSEGQGKSN